MRHRILALAFLLLSCIPACADLPEWTVLVFMNGNNNLAPEIDVNYAQMSQVGSTDKINLLIQAARNDKMVLRGIVKKSALLDESGGFENLGDVDMGAPAAIESFIRYGIKRYPARKYMLIIWNHGQGWRAAEQIQPGSAKPSDRTPTPYRYISTDDLHNSKLYNKDVQLALERIVADSTEKGGLEGRKIDLLAFDACLMAMIETSYAFRNSAEVMVASEELVPGLGFPYDIWLSRLLAKPAATPVELSEILVRAYGDYYSPSMHRDETTTLSATDLKKATDLAKDFSEFAAELKASVPTTRLAILSARRQCPVYAPNSEGDGVNYFYHVDLGCFLDSFFVKAPNEKLKNITKSVRASLSSAILHNYRGSARETFGSNGLAIYFPQTRTQLKQDQFAEKGYEKTNNHKPVDFVKELHWADLLYAVLQ